MSITLLMKWSDVKTFYDVGMRHPVLLKTLSALQTPEEVLETQLVNRKS